MYYLFVFEVYGVKQLGIRCPEVKISHGSHKYFFPLKIDRIQNYFFAIGLPKFCLSVFYSDIMFFFCFVASALFFYVIFQFFVSFVFLLDWMGYFELFVLFSAGCFFRFNVHVLGFHISRGLVFNIFPPHLLYTPIMYVVSCQ